MTDMTPDRLEDLRDRPGVFRQIATFARKQPLGTAGGVGVLFYIVMAVFAPYITGIDPTENFYQYQFVAPGAQFLMGGLVVTEQVFNLNGLGRLLVDSVTQVDYTMTQGIVMVIVLVFVITNFIVDILYAWLDPRIRYS